MDRLQFQNLLETLLDSPSVYFQPPPNLVIEYPCIIYERFSADTRFAGNYPYSYNIRYQVKVIDRNPDSEIPRRVANLRSSVFNRHYTIGGLHHDVFNLYY